MIRQGWNSPARMSHSGGVTSSPLNVRASADEMRQQLREGSWDSQMRLKPLGQKCFEPKMRVPSGMREDFASFAGASQFKIEPVAV